MNSTKNEISIQIKGDYYARSESSWNIRDSLGNYVFSQDKTFSESNEYQTEKIKFRTRYIFFKMYGFLW